MSLNKPIKIEESEKFDLSNLPIQINVLDEEIHLENSLSRLQPETYLNDEVINFMINLFH